MEVYPADGNPIIALILISFSTFKESSLTAAFTNISLSFNTDEAANQFVKDIEFRGCSQSSSESNNVLVIPDYAGSENAARAIYHAVSAYKDHLISVNKLVISHPLEKVVDHPLKDIEDYLERHFGAGAVTVK